MQGVVIVYFPENLRASSSQQTGFQWLLISQFFPGPCLNGAQNKSHQKATFIPILNSLDTWDCQIGFSSHLLVVSKPHKVSNSPVSFESAEGSIWSRNHRAGARALASRAQGSVTMALDLQPWPGLFHCLVPNHCRVCLWRQSFVWTERLQPYP